MDTYAEIYTATPTFRGSVTVYTHEDGVIVPVVEVGAIGDALIFSDAEALLATAGFTTTEPWIPVPMGYIAQVHRIDATSPRVEGGGTS